VANLPAPSLGPFGIVVLGGTVALAIWYLGAIRQLRALKDRRWSHLRTVAFLAGLLAVDLGLVWPVAPLTMKSFSAHAVQHLSMMDIGPVLLALGTPTTLLLQTASRRVKGAVLKVLQSRAFAALHMPVVVWLLFYGAMYFFFLTGAINFAMQPGHEAVMDCWNLFFLASGCLFWWPVLAVDPIPHWRMSPGTRFLSLFLGIPFNSFLGIAIISMTAPIASMYSLGSTHAGGNILWGTGEAFTIFPMLFLLNQLGDRENRADSRRERAERRAAERARRARAAGRVPVAPARQMSYWESVWVDRVGYLPTDPPLPTTAAPEGAGTVSEPSTTPPPPTPEPAAEDGAIRHPAAS